MFNNFTKQKFTFEFKNKTFEMYNEDLILELLGKKGKQTAINIGGSAWKRTIKRYKTRRQKESEKK